MCVFWMVASSTTGYVCFLIDRATPICCLQLTVASMTVFGVDLERLGQLPWTRVWVSPLWTARGVLAALLVNHQRSYLIHSLHMNCFIWSAIKASTCPDAPQAFSERLLYKILSSECIVIGCQIGIMIPCVLFIHDRVIIYFGCVTDHSLSIE